MRTNAKQFLTRLAAGGLILLLASCNKSSVTQNKQEAAQAAAAAPTSRSLHDPVPTRAGLIAGTAGKVAGIMAFKGIPFGAPPVGPLRWQPPRPVTPWDGVRAGDKFGAVCMQLPALQRNPNNVSTDLPDSPPISSRCTAARSS